MDWNGISPGEAMGYYAAPAERVVAVTIAPKLVAAGNPYRTGIIFYANGAASGLVATSLAVLNSGGGMSVSPLVAPITLLVADWGSLVQLPWFGMSSGGGNIGIIETTLIRWPGEQAPGQQITARSRPSDPWPDHLAMSWRRSNTFAGSALSMPSADEVDIMFSGVRNGS